MSDLAATRRSVAGSVLPSSLYVLGGQAVAALVSFCATPAIVRSLGPAGYGILAFVNVMLAYLAWADLGMSVSSTRLAAQVHREDQGGEEAKVIWTALAIALIGTVPASLAVFGASGWISRSVLHLSGAAAGHTAFALRVACIALLARSAVTVLNTPQLVRMRFDLNSAVTAGGSVLQTLMILVAALLTREAEWAVVAIVIAASISAIVNYLMSRRLLPQLGHFAFDSAIAGRLWRFGRSLLISAIAAAFLSSADKLLLPRFASVEELGHYSIAFTFAMLFTLFPSSLSQALLPAFSRLAREEGATDDLRSMYVRAARLNLLCAIPALVTMLAFSPFVLRLWVGDLAVSSIVPLNILLIGVFFNVLAVVPQTALLAVGESAYIARLHAAEVLPYVVGVAVLVSRGGAAGAAAAWAVRVTIDSAFLFFGAQRALKKREAIIDRHSALVLSVLLIAVAVAVLVLHADPRIACGASLLIYGPLVWFQVLYGMERESIRLLVRRLRETVSVRNA